MISLQQPAAALILTFLLLLSASTTTTTTLGFVSPTTRHFYYNNSNNRSNNISHNNKRIHQAAAPAAASNEGQLTKGEAELLFDETNAQKVQTSSRTVTAYGNIVSKSASSSSSSSKEEELDHSSDSKVNKLRQVRDTLKSCPSLWGQIAQIYPTTRALLDEHLCDETKDLTFEDVDLLVRKSGTVFRDLGVTKGVNVAILGENSANWLVVDHGIQIVGGASAVRGANAPVDELRYIYEHSDSKQIVVLQGPSLLSKLHKAASNNSNDDASTPLGLSNKYGDVKHVVLMHKEKKDLQDMQSKFSYNGKITIQFLDDLLDKASPLMKSELPVIERDELSTIVYTSGTTGNPKGVMLTHGNLLHQTGHRLLPTKTFDEGEPLPGHCMLSLLPVWHITERTFELWQLSRGSAVVYSSIRTFKNDLAKHKPEWLVLVPRVLEKVAQGVQAKFADGSVVVRGLVKLFTATGSTSKRHSKIAAGLVVGDSQPSKLSKLKSKAIVASLAPLNAVGNKLVWSKVQQGFGGNQRVIISGGSALSGSLESFYELCGIKICVGYGLTECSPLIAFRRGDSNLVTAGCVGKPCSDTEVRVVDPEASSELDERESVPMGQVGVVLARGPQVTKGYYKNPEATSKAIDRFGWFNTGDLGRINPATGGDLILTGRCKDTIVLSNGENVEPTPIEDAIIAGSGDLIDQIMVTGQDKRELTAIIVLNPSELGARGFMDAKLAKQSQKASDVINEPKCTVEECDEMSKILLDASKELRSNEQLNSELSKALRSATGTKEFMPWECVNKFYITLEPFAMANGLLTQSYKVKRDQVLNKFESLIFED